MYPLRFGLFDPTMLILIPTIILTLFAQNRVRSNFEKYLKVPSRKGYTGLQVARLLLDQHGLQNIPIELSSGTLSDHYDPGKKVLRLSGEVYRGTSIASISVAAHEVGHAIQHANDYTPLILRNRIFPIARFGSSAAWIFIFVGLLIPSLGSFMDVGIILFATAVLFQLVTLPVEFNASSRALDLLDANGILSRNEEQGAKKVLNAAALTYVAAMAAGVAQLLRLILIRGRRD